MTNLFDKVKVVCALVVMGIGLAAYSAAPRCSSAADDFWRRTRR